MKANATQLIKILVAELQEYQVTVDKQIKYNDNLKKQIDSSFAKKIEVDTNNLEILSRNLIEKMENSIVSMEKTVKRANNVYFYAVMAILIGVLFFSVTFYMNDKEDKDLKAENEHFREFLRENPKNAEVYETWRKSKIVEDEINKKSN